MLPISVVALVLGVARLPDVGERRRTVIDPLSVLLSVIGFGGLVYGLSAVGERVTGGETIPLAFPALLGTVAIAWFIVRQLRLQREDRALLDLRTFTVRPYAWSVALLFCTSIALFGSLIILPIFVQRVLGFSTFESGLVLLPGGLLMAALGPLVGRLVDRRGARFVLLPGIVLTAGALWSMVLFDTQTAFWQVLLTHMLLSAGLAGVFTPVFAVALGSLPMQLASYGAYDCHGAAGGGCCRNCALCDDYDARIEYGARRASCCCAFIWHERRLCGGRCGSHCGRSDRVLYY